MKKHKFLIALFVMALLIIGPVLASDLSDNLPSTYNIGRSQQDEYDRLSDAATDILRLEGMDICFTPADFIANDGSTAAAITASTAPGLEVDNSAVAIVWADGETTPVQVTFRVTKDGTGGTFYAVVDEATGDGTPCQVDFNVYVNKDGVKFDAAASDQTPVALSYDPGTPDVLTLSVATDFAALAVGDIVTFSIWRDNTAGVGTGDLELYYVGFKRS